MFGVGMGELLPSGIDVSKFMMAQISWNISAYVRKYGT